ncbi:MAG: PVC-type heme-binding CxxCH protein [Pirellulales bacterium]
MTTDSNRPCRLFFLWIAVVLLIAGTGAPAFAQRDLKNIPDPDPQAQLQTLEVAEGFEINLFASDPMIAKPIQMNFDSAGRLWVASSEVYPQIEPGQVADDKIIVLEDTDGDGAADESTVFADGLLIPTGVLPGDGGVYVANSTELLHMTDTDGDGRADESRVVLSGFGTEDTHHILHTLRWGPEGLLYMNQSIYIHSHIETPHGVRRMNGSGIWHFRPETMELDTFMLGLVNPWGHHFDRYGQSFATDGAGGEGINYVFPGFVGMTSPGATRILNGLNPGSPKYCGLEVLSGRHLPPEWQGNLITNDFRAHRVCRFVLSDDGSGFASREMDELVKSSHVAFRPVDVKMGPDGAIYIADWYNPIIQHGEVDFRDPRRDHKHGRIWRITAKDRPLVPQVNLAEASVDELLAALTSPEAWTRTHAKLEMKERGAEVVLPALDAWTAEIQSDEDRLEALWAYQALNRTNETLTTALLASADPRIRAAATRVLYHQHDRFPEPAALLAERVADEHPRVRLEAVRALSRLNTAEACVIAMRALDQPVDEFLDFALWQTARDLEDHWMPALAAGEINFRGNVSHLTFALKAVESPDVVPHLVRQLQSGSVNSAGEAEVYSTIASLATAEDAGNILRWVLDGDVSPRQQAGLLEALAEAAKARDARPSGNLHRVAGLLESPSVEVQAAAAKIIGAWRVEGRRDQIAQLATAEATDARVRSAAIEGLVLLGGEASKQLLAKLATQHDELPIREAAVTGLAALDVQAAARLGAGLLAAYPASADPTPLVEAFLRRQRGAAALATAVKGATIPGDVARLAMRTVRSSGRQEPELVTALSAAGGLDAGSRTLDGEELSQFLADVAASGDAVRGEAVYRREDQACLKCHAIAGAGGLVGPDVASIGASAQPDYLVESLLAPGAKIKENYHTVTVATDTGQVLSGVKVRETQNELILRDAEDREIRVPLDSIVQQNDGGSLMPVGLTDPLTRSELVDLVRFLSELGKEGPYAVNNERVVRRWRVLADSRTNARRLRRGDVAAVASDPESLDWLPAYSRVDGTLPMADVPTIAADRSASPLGVLQFELDVSAAGTVQIVLDSVAGLTVYLDSELVETAPAIDVNLNRGRHLVTLAVDLANRDQPLRVKLADPPEGTPATVQIVTGK